jgi:hypothetical protein
MRSRVSGTEKGANIKPKSKKHAHLLSFCGLSRLYVHRHVIGWPMNSNRLGRKWSCLNSGIMSTFVWRQHENTKASVRRAGIRAAQLLNVKPKPLPADQPASVWWHQTTYPIRILFLPRECTKHSLLSRCGMFTLSYIFVVYLTTLSVSRLYSIGWLVNVEQFVEW